ncbi:hypothetical protein [Nibricoccus sp. IMCC34717]|uniref:hypothetical protein n=1 Tax=Nibricoccus sp. IMCC34717 TaxID=3034021 RepID=UPI00384B67BA
MSYWIKRLLHRPAIELGRVDNSRIQTTPIRNAQFVSFLSSNGSFSRRCPDRHDQRLRRRRTLKSLALACAAAAVIWVAIESAQALTLF